MEERVDEAIRKELQPMIEKAKKEFRARVDELLSGAIADGLKKALGLER